MELEERNKKPANSSENLPKAVLVVLVSIVCLLLYIGWEMISDRPSNVNELSSVPIEELVSNEEAEETNTAVETYTEELEVEPEVPAPVELEKKELTQNAETITTHTVNSGETLFSIANRYNLKLSTLKSYNEDIQENEIKAGVTKLRIPIQSIHTVGPGDILRVVGGKYNVSVDQLMKANAKAKNYAERGEKLIIPFSDRY